MTRVYYTAERGATEGSKSWARSRSWWVASNVQRRVGRQSIRELFVLFRSLPLLCEVYLLFSSLCYYHVSRPVLFVVAATAVVDGDNKTRMPVAAVFPLLHLAVVVVGR